MTLTKLIIAVIQISMILTVFCVALNASPRDITYLLRKPGLLVRSLLAMNVIMPVFAAVIALAFRLHPALEMALVVLALSPVPPILPGKQLKAGGNFSYVVGLLAIAALVSIVFIP